MIFKAVGGVSSPKAGHLWNSPLTLSENVNAALDITATHPGHYKNRIVLNWTTFNPQEVNLRLAYQTELSWLAQHLPLTCFFVCLFFLLMKLSWLLRQPSVVVVVVVVFFKAVIYRKTTF